MLSFCFSGAPTLLMSLFFRYCKEYSGFESLRDSFPCENEMRKISLKHLVRLSVILEDTRAATLGVVSKKLGSILTKYLFTMFVNSESPLKEEEQIQLSSI